MMNKEQNKEQKLLKNISKEELDEILKNHAKSLTQYQKTNILLYSEPYSTSRALLMNTNLKGFDLSGIDLSFANLSNSDLSFTDLRKTNLRGANLQGANLSNAILTRANLSDTYLMCADLTKAILDSVNLTGADLLSANLNNAYLYGANLYRANLRSTNLQGANLNGANLGCATLINADLSHSVLDNANFMNATLSNVNLDCIEFSDCTAFFALQCPETGSFTAYKKAGEYVVKLLIPEDAKRSSATTRKCRASKAKVISFHYENRDIAEIDSVPSNYDDDFIYTIGDTLVIEDFDEDRWNECSTGIHFFLTFDEARNYL